MCSSPSRRKAQQSLLSELLRVDAVLGQHVVERGTADVEGARRAADVAAAPHQRVDDQATLALIARLSQSG